MAEVTLYPGETIEQAMRRFKRQVLREGIIREAKRRTFFLKPCEAKKLKSKLARSRSRKNMSFR